jgi:murein DD-endopeptidase MepM/ murein hydrolase activator NlpD
MLQQRTIKRLAGGLVLPLMLAACASSDNWWENGNRSPRNGYDDSGYVNQTPMPAPVRSSGGSYVVRRGVTLYQVSRETNIPLRSLIDANNLEPPYALQAGQRLVIPTARFHVVQRGDTVYSISRTYGVDMATLTRTNHIQAPYRIKLGEKLQLPSRVNTQVTSNDDMPAARSVPMSRPGTTYTTPSATTVSTQPKGPLPPPPTPAGDFVWPAQGKIISTFGEKENGLHNDGINIAVPSGTPVRAAQNGVVAYAGNELKGYGNLLLVRHANGWMTAYAHNSKLLVRRGDTVVKGQTISLAGATGSVTSPQVHFEIRKGAKAVDPRSVIGG